MSSPVEPDRAPSPEPDLPNPRHSLFAPKSLEDVKARLERIKAWPCHCADEHHVNALHDLAEDDVPVLIAEIERLRKLLPQNGQADA